jgi:hypothetical protein
LSRAGLRRRRQGEASALAGEVGDGQVSAGDVNVWRHGCG